MLAKIGESLEGVISLDLEALTEEFTVLADDHARADAGVWGAVAKAIERRERLRLTYQRFDGATGLYEIEPYHLVAYHGNWYVLARKAAGAQMETFALSRCRELSAAGQHFARAPDFDSAAWLREGFGITRAERPWRVRLLFSRRVATYIQERVWHATQQLRARRDGSVELRLETSGRQELTRWILSWMPEVTVLARRELRHRVVARMEAGLEQNR